MTNVVTKKRTWRVEVESPTGTWVEAPEFGKFASAENAMKAVDKWKRETFRATHNLYAVRRSYRVVTALVAS